MTKLKCQRTGEEDVNMSWSQGKPFQFFDRATGKSQWRILMPLLVDEQGVPLGCVLEADLEAGTLTRLIPNPDAPGTYDVEMTTGRKLRLMFAEEIVDTGEELAAVELRPTPSYGETTGDLAKLLELHEKVKANRTERLDELRKWFANPLEKPLPELIGPLRLEFKSGMEEKLQELMKAPDFYRGAVLLPVDGASESELSPKTDLMEETVIPPNSGDPDVVQLEKEDTANEQGSFSGDDASPSGGNVPA